MPTAASIDDRQRPVRRSDLVILGDMRPPLLEEESDRGVSALVAELTSPARVNRPCSMTRFPSHDEPVDTRQSQSLKRPERRFGTDEPTAGTRRRSSARPMKRLFSIETPIQTLGGHGNRGASAASRSARLVSTWKVCQCARAMISKTPRTNVSGTASWKRSDIELTKTNRGFRQVSGRSNRAGHSRGSNPCS